MNDHSKTTPPASPQSPKGPVVRLESGEILKGANTVEIEHAGQRYLLRVTRENKLILTK